MLRTCYAEDPGVLLTDFSCAFASVDHRSIVMVLERADVRLLLQNFLRRIYPDSNINFEYSGATMSSKLITEMRGADLIVFELIKSVIFVI